MSCSLREPRQPSANSVCFPHHRHAFERRGSSPACTSTHEMCEAHRTTNHSFFNSECLKSPCQHTAAPRILFNGECLQSACQEMLVASQTSVNRHSWPMDRCIFPEGRSPQNPLETDVQPKCALCFNVRDFQANCLGCDEPLRMRC